MQALPRSSTMDSVGAIWSVLHAGAEIFVSRDELHFLRTVALGLDDDLASDLLIAKLKLANVVEVAEVPPETVTMGGYVEFSLDGHTSPLRRLVHPSDKPPTYGLSIGSLLGVGVLGLQAGQLILWPDSKGRLCKLHVARVVDREQTAMPRICGV